MRVHMNIETITKKRLFGTTDDNFVKLSVDFTEEERYLIKKHGLANEPLFTLGSEDMPINYTLAYLLKGKEYCILCQNLFDAKDTMQAIEEKFRLVKDMLNAADTTPESRTFEL